MIIQEHYSLEIQFEYYRLIDKALSLCFIVWIGLLLGEERLHTSFCKICLSTVFNLLHAVMKQLKESETFFSVWTLRIFQRFVESPLLKRLLFLSPFLGELNDIVFSLLPKVSFCTSSYLSSLPELNPSSTDFCSLCQ